MRKTISINLEDLLHAINILGEDRDVYVDGYGSIAVCPPVKLTPAGRAYFQQALKANVDVVYSDDSHEETYVSDADEAIDEMANNLLKSLAGYCYADGYDQWFEGEEAVII